ncbi:unnamed protein product, partial [Brenthis ino]
MPVLDKTVIESVHDILTLHGLKLTDSHSDLSRGRRFNHIEVDSKVELCVEALGEVVSLLARDDVGPVEADRGELARALLPTVLRIAATMMRDRNREEGIPNEDPLLRKLICVLLDMVRQMSEEQYTVVMRSLDAEGAGRGHTLLTDALALMMALLQRPVFRPHWADMLHLQHYVMLHALRLLATTLRENLTSITVSEEVEQEAVGAVHATMIEWFGAVGAVAASPPLQLEALPAARRQRALVLYGDIRRQAAALMADMWFSLEDHKRFFITHLVGTFLEVSFLRDEEVRNTTIPLFFDMMQTEYKYTAESGEGNLRSLENELIDKLDVLAEAGRGDAAWRARFVSLCGALAHASPLRVPAAALVAAAARQLDALLRYRAAAPPRRVHLVPGVLRFYEEIERPHMYIRYVHRLAAMHCAGARWAEAALALQLHAKLLAWSDEPLPPRLRHPDRADRDRTHLDLKIYLYEEISSLLDRGQQWELAVRCTRELVGVYERRARGYAALAALHETLARLYRAPLTHARLRAVYFRVRYLGGGFPDHMQNPKGFVFRGNEGDMLHNFKERMLEEWPEAEVLLKLDEPGNDITMSEGQYLQINAVTPIMDEKWRALLGKSVDDHLVRSYYEHNNVKKFHFSRPFHKTDDAITELTEGKKEDLMRANEFATRWLERTELEISDTLPGILQWFPVVSTRTYWVCPLEVAVETMLQTNDQLKTTILEASDDSAPLHPLSMRLQGILDSAVQGGLIHYKLAFLTPEYEARRPEHAALLQKLRDLISDQVPLLKYGLEVHARRNPQRDLHDHLVKCFRDRMSEFESGSPVSPEVVLRARDDAERHLPHAQAPARLSDVSAGNGTTPKSKSKLNSALNWTRRDSSSGTLTPRHKKRSRKNFSIQSETSLQSSGSQWYTSNSPNANSHAHAHAHNSAGAINNAIISAINTALNNNVLDAPFLPLKELRQELVTERPPRAEAGRLSQRTSFITNSEPPSNRDSLGTTDSNQDEEEPPPLPQKQHKTLEADADNNNTPRHNYDLVLAPRNSYLYQSRRRETQLPLLPLLPDNEKAPTPPPKKRYQNNV